MVSIDDAVLDTYESERISHAKHYIDFSQELGNIICIIDPEEAAVRDRNMMADLQARNYQPITGDLVHLGTGAWCEDTKAAGELSTQGVVQVNGKQDRFDQAVGQGWMVIGLNHDPANALNEHQLTALSTLGGKTIEIGSPGTECDVIDIEGTYAQWMKSIDANYFILRPDFYVAASAHSPDDLSRRFDELLKKLHFKHA